MGYNSKTVQHRADEKRKDARARAWWCIVYQESIEDMESWIKVLEDQLLEILVSPLHDKDLKDDGSLKKPHYHVIISYKNPTNYRKAVEFFDSIGGVYPNPETSWSLFLKECRIRNFSEASSYLCHLYQPKKHRYNTEDVMTFGAVDYLAVIRTDELDDKVLDEIEEFIEVNQVVSFNSFQRYVRRYRPEWRYYIRHKYAYYLRETIKGNAWAIEHHEFIENVELLFMDECMNE